MVHASLHGAKGRELLHRSDRGSQYASELTERTLKTLGIECSMSRRGLCYDNAAMERFFWSLKHEWTKHEQFENLAVVRLQRVQVHRNALQSRAIAPDARPQIPRQVRTRIRPDYCGVN